MIAHIEFRHNNDEQFGRTLGEVPQMYDSECRFRSCFSAFSYISLSIIAALATNQLKHCRKPTSSRYPQTLFFQFSGTLFVRYFVISYRKKSKLARLSVPMIVRCNLCKACSVARTLLVVGLRSSTRSYCKNWNLPVIRFVFASEPISDSYAAC